MPVPAVRTFLVRAALVVASLLATFGAAEAVVRLVDGGGLPSLPIFAQLADGLIVLQSDVEVRHRHQNGHVYTLTTAAYGLRGPAPADIGPARGWLAVGDSQVLGLGVGDSSTFSAIATARDVPMANAGVPGHGVEDALAHAAILLPLLRPKGVLVVVNQANDWEEAGHPVQERLRVRGSWLLQPADAEGWKGAFMASPLSRSHFMFFAAQLLHVTFAPRRPAPQSPAWLSRPGGEEPTTARMADAIRVFAKAHSEVQTIVCFLPVDVATSPERVAKSPFRSLLGDRQPWQDHDLRDQLARELAGVRFIDLLPTLTDHPEAFLDDDYHLSQIGHALVADTIVRDIVDLAREK